jgi:tRNA(Ile)-lysidine synthase
MPLCAKKWHRAVSRPDAETLAISVAALIGKAATQADQFGIAVSGGADSLALLLLAQAAFPGRIAAASVDHRLRHDAASECAHVADICAALGVPHSILTAAAPPHPSQASARELRYALLENWRADNGIDWLMTGHHADDQLETMVMRLNRRSGVGGLAGVRARNGRVLRPLLGWRRADLAALVAAAGLTPVDDPSNRDPRHDRARLRAAMADQQWLDPLAVSASAAHLAAAEEALDWAAQRLLAAHKQPVEGGFNLVTAGWPDELLRRAIAIALAGDGRSAPRGAELDRFIAKLRSGDPVTLAGWTARPVRQQPHIWHFQPERRGRAN